MTVREFKDQGQRRRVLWLSRQQHRVLLALVRDHLSMQHAAQRLGLSYGTMRNYSAVLCRQLKVEGRAGLFEFAMQYPEILADDNRGVPIREHGSACPCPACYSVRMREAA